MIDIDEIIKILENENISFIRKPNKKGDLFERVIEFETKYQKYVLVWYKNIGTLSIGDQYSNSFKFDSVFVRDWSCTCIKDLVFTNSSNKSFYGEFSIVLKKLDWQEINK